MSLRIVSLIAAVLALAVVPLGDRAPVPFLALNVEPPEDALARAERLDLYMKHGLTVSAKWLRDVESIPDPTDGEEVVGGKPSAPPKPIDPAAPKPAAPADEAA